MTHLIKLAALYLCVGFYSGTVLADSFGSGGGAVTINQAGISVGVAPASTPATTAQPALVTGFSPNSPLPTGTNTIGNEANGADTTATGTLTSAGTVSVATNGAATVTVSAVLSGTTPTDTFSIQGQMPDASWQTVNVYPIPATTTGAPTAQPISQSAAGSGEWIIPTAGFSHVRLNLTAITGTTPSLVVTFNASQAAAFPTVNTIIAGVSNVAVPVAMQTCQQYSYFDGTAALSGANAFTPAVSATSGHVIHICGYTVASGTAAATNLGLDTAPATCGTTNTKLTPYWQLTAGGGKVVSNAFWEGLQSPSTGVVLCLNASAANAVQAEVWYSIY